MQPLLGKFFTHPFIIKSRCRKSGSMLHWASPGHDAGMWKWKSLHSIITITEVYLHIVKYWGFLLCSSRGFKGSLNEVYQKIIAWETSEPSQIGNFRTVQKQRLAICLIATIRELIWSTFYGFDKSLAWCIQMVFYWHSIDSLNRLDYSKSAKLSLWRDVMFLVKA